MTATFFIGITEESIVVRVTGHGTREYGPAFVAEVSAAVHQMPDQTLIVDLEQCEFLDSTFLGCLVTLFQKTKTRMYVCAGEAQQLRLFSSARIDRLIPVRKPNTVRYPEQWRRISGCGERDACALAETVVEAHRYLAGIEGPNAETYRKVADQLECELQSRLPK